MIALQYVQINKYINIYIFLIQQVKMLIDNLKKYF